MPKSIQGPQLPSLPIFRGRQRRLEDHKEDTTVSAQISAADRFLEDLLAPMPTSIAGQISAHAQVELRYGPTSAQGTKRVRDRQVEIIGVDRDYLPATSTRSTTQLVPATAKRVRVTSTTPPALSNKHPAALPIGATRPLAIEYAPTTTSKTSQQLLAKSSNKAVAEETALQSKHDEETKALKQKLDEEIKELQTKRAAELKALHERHKRETEVSDKNEIAGAALQSAEKALDRAITTMSYALGVIEPEDRSKVVVARLGNLQRSLAAMESAVSEFSSAAADACEVCGLQEKEEGSTTDQSQKR